MTNKTLEEMCNSNIFSMLTLYKEVDLFIVSKDFTGYLPVDRVDMMWECLKKGMPIQEFLDSSAAALFKYVEGPSPVLN